jgi:hypothetical protein
MKTIRLILIVALAFLLAPTSALAQTYSFSLDRQDVHVYWNEDGTTSIDYTFTFTNDSFASPIDFVDVGLPNRYFDESSIFADVDGRPITYISASEYQASGTGVAIGLENYAIRPGQTGKLHVYIGIVRRMLRLDTEDRDYTSGLFSPTWFGSQYVHGDTNLNVTYHFPPGVQSTEPRWHAAPDGWATEPSTGFDNDGRITYTWGNAFANGYTQYIFGASFPRQYVPASAIQSMSIWERLGISEDTFAGLTMCSGFVAFFAFVTGFSIWSGTRRKKQYMPPRIAIEGHGIKRGLTAIEAAILMEQPLDKVLTMVLFAVIKKNAAQVLNREPLTLEFTDPEPEGLQDYEKDFLKAFRETSGAARKRLLQEMTVNLVKSVSAKIKGFSRKETITYYKDIINRAWAQVEAASTPEVKSQKFDEVMEWTMLDRDYDDRTRRVFTGPVFVPTWYPRYDPVYRRSVASAPTPTPSSGGGMALPNLPGSDFAASMVNGVQNFSSKVVGNITEFTNSVTNKTNPVPVTTSSGRSSGGRSGGGGCACACACAGCACACAGGGR